MCPDRSSQVSDRRIRPSTWCRTILLTSLCLLSGWAAATGIAEPGPRDILTAYLQARDDGDWDGAQAFWLTADLERAARLGITYRDVPLKIDCASPLFQTDPPAGSRFAICEVEPGETVSRISVGRIASGDTLLAVYDLVLKGGCWRLAGPATALGDAWPVITGDYLRFHVQPGRVLPAGGIADLDRFVGRTGRRLGMSPARLQRLGSEKIDYYFCDEGTVARIAGTPTRGLALLPVDAVATSEPAHHHELAHLLVNYAVADLPLYTLPVLQEGLAVHLGGRWGRSPRVMSELGRYVLEAGFIDLDSLLSWDGFRREMADLTYAPSGVLAGLLLDRLGPTGFLALYRDLSGSPKDLVALKSGAIRREMEARLGLPPGGLAAALTESCQGLPGGGFEAGLPGEPATRLTLTQPGRTAVIHLGADWIGFDIRVSDGQSNGAITLIPGPGFAPVNNPASRLFRERFPGASYGGERAAVVFGAQEAGVYDFATDILAAKHVEDFRPLSGFFHEAETRWRFRIRRGVFPDSLQHCRWRLLSASE